MSSEDLSEHLAKLAEHRQLLETTIQKRIVGQKKVLRQIQAALLSRGHCVLVGVPGLAKTAMVRTIALALDLDFKRIQFTPDLMPSDITGTEILEESATGHREFRFVKGPLFSNIILADEINRTPPKTQAALLEAMQERQVTIGNQTYDLPDPLFIIATQNPIEQEGTYPLPEAQLDRFMFNIHVDYPNRAEEEEIINLTAQERKSKISQVISADTIRHLQKLVRKIIFSQDIVKYVAGLVRATRPGTRDAPEFVNELVEWGAGPRAGQFLLMGARAMAALDGRSWVSYQDVIDVSVPVLRHRMATNFKARAEGIDTVALVHKLVEHVPRGTETKYAER